MKTWVQAHQVLDVNPERKHTSHADDVAIDHIMQQKNDVLKVDSAPQQK